MIGRFCALMLAAVVLLTAALPARAGLAQDRREVEHAYQDLVRSVVRIETRYASIFAPAGAGSGVVPAAEVMRLLNRQTACATAGEARC